MIKNKSYLVMFFLSLQLLLLQVTLALLLNVLIQLPFLAISFAFLGLSTSGVYYYIRYSDKEIKHPEKFLSRNILIYAYSLMVLIGGLKLYSNLKLAHDTNFVSTAPANLSFLTIIKHNLLNISLGTFTLGLLFSIAFFWLGLTIVMIYKHRSDNAPRLYLYDLLGATLGCILGVFLLNLFTAISILILQITLSFLLAFYIIRDTGNSKLKKQIIVFFILLSSVLFLFNVKTKSLEVALNPHFLANDFKGKKICEEIWSKWNFYSRVGLVKYKNPDDKNYRHTFSIGYVSGRAHLLPFDPKNPYRFKLFEKFHPSSLGFLLSQPEDFLVLFAGAGRDMLEAYSYSKGAANITGVELNPLIVRKAVSLPEFHLKEFFEKENVNMVVAEGRSFLEKTDQLYDTIILSWAGASLANYLGTSGYTTQYLYTREAVTSFLEHLKPNGTIGIVNGNKIRLLLITIKAFEGLGYENINKKIVILEKQSLLDSGLARRNIFDKNGKSYLLIKNRDFTKKEVSHISKNIEKMGLSWVYNPYYVHPDFKIYKDILNMKNMDQFIYTLNKTQLRDFSIITDDRPLMQNDFLVENIFSSRFWSVLSPHERSQYPYHYFIHFFTISFILGFIFIGSLLILTPLILKNKTKLTWDELKALYHFAVLGFGFMFVEIAVMQQFNLLLGNPIYAFSIILSTLLLSTGIGSVLSDFFFDRKWLDIKRQSLVIAFILIGYFYILSEIIEYFLGAPLILKFFITALLIAPLGIALGMLFPQGLKRLHKSNPNLIPWAWALNSYMSIVGSLISYYLSFAFGFNILFLLAAFLYLTLFVLRPRMFSE